MMIYLVEDDANIRELVVYTLCSTGFEAQGFERPSLFFKALETSIPDLVLLDIMLPEENGLSILSKLKASSKTRDIPIIMLTAKGTEIDKVKGFENGADDYIVKPFGMMELVARVKARLRSRKNVKALSEYSMGDLYVCPKKHIVRVKDENIILNEESTDYRWCDINEFTNLIHWFYDKEQLKDIIEKYINTK